MSRSARTGLLKLPTCGGAADGSLRLSAARRIELNDTGGGKTALPKSADEADWPLESLICVVNDRQDQGLSYCMPSRRLRQWRRQSDPLGMPYNHSM